MSARRSPKASAAQKEADVLPFILQFLLKLVIHGGDPLVLLEAAQIAVGDMVELLDQRGPQRVVNGAGTRRGVRLLRLAREPFPAKIVPQPLFSIWRGMHWERELRIDLIPISRCLRGRLPNLQDSQVPCMSPLTLWSNMVCEIWCSYWLRGRRRSWWTRGDQKHG